MPNPVSPTYGAFGYSTSGMVRRIYELLEIDEEETDDFNEDGEEDGDDGGDDGGSDGGSDGGGGDGGDYADVYKGEAEAAPEFPNGPVHTVYCSSVTSSLVVFGGNFSMSGETPMNNIGMFLLKSQQWISLGSGVDGVVYAIAEDSTFFYVGGTFQSDFASPNIALYDQDVGWFALGGGVDGPVYSIYVLTSDAVYVGGDFHYAQNIESSVHAPGLAVWNATSNAWSYNDTGVNGTITSIIFFKDHLYVAGNFSFMGTPTCMADLTDNVVIDGFKKTVDFLIFRIWGRINNLATFDGNLVAAGDFVLSGLNATVHLAVLKENGWEPFFSDVNGPALALLTMKVEGE